MKNTKLLFAIFLLIAQLSFSQNLTITDSYFKQFLLSADSGNTFAKDLAGNFTKIDTNNDGEIQVTEAANIKEISTVSFPLRTLINEIDVRQFSNLEELDCRLAKMTPFETGLVSSLQYIKASGLSKLRSIDARKNSLISVDASHCPLLTDINIQDSNLISPDILSTNDTTIKNINLENCTSLISFNNSLTSLENLNIKNCTALSSLFVSDNNLSNLNITGCVNLESLSCGNNSGLTNIDFSSFVKLKFIECGGNPLFTELDFSHQPLLQLLDCSSSPSLTKINIQNGSVLSNFYFAGNENLELICCDSNETGTVQDLAYLYGYPMYGSPNLSISSTCNLVLNTNKNLKAQKDEINFNNPFSNELILNSKEKIKDLELYDGSGRMVIKAKDSKQIATSNLNRGIYFIKVTTESGRMISKKAIKN